MNKEEKLDQNDIIVKEADIDDVIQVSKNIIEFDEWDISKEYFENRYQEAEKLIVVAYYNKKPIGYVIGYDKFQDNKESFYCWLAGVDYNYRRMGALTALMNYQKEWAKKKGYRKIKIRTRNDKREMLSFLVKSGFNFVSIEERECIDDNRINLEIEL